MRKQAAAFVSKSVEVLIRLSYVLKIMKLTSLKAIVDPGRLAIDVIANPSRLGRLEPIWLKSDRWSLADSFRRTHPQLSASWQARYSPDRAAVAASVALATALVLHLWSMTRGIVKTLNGPHK